MPHNRPNILLIITDQQSATMMGCAGNRYLQTPAMDSLAESGLRFQRAYCCNPMCGPSRFSLMTGRLPSEADIRNHDDSHIESISAHITEQSLGWMLRRTGYATAFGGKFHMPKQMRPEDIGFDTISTDQRDELTEDCIHFLNEERDAPFFLVASFINPHDICYMAIQDSAATDQERGLLERGVTELAALNEALQLPDGMDEETFYADICPPLPENFEPQTDEPEAIRQMQTRSPFKGKARARWDERRWRLHRWAYHRLTERVDAQIGRVLDGLRASGQRENTLVIFTSDHGDMDAAHRMEHKTAFYEEAAHIPLILSWPGMIEPGTVDAGLVSNGLDLLPTLCDYAGVDAPSDIAGQSLRPLAEGRHPEAWRTALPVESEIGRMIVTDRFKYMRYDEGEDREQLIDLITDPGEMRNAIGDAGTQKVLEALRHRFDEVFSSEWSAVDFGKSP